MRQLLKRVKPTSLEDISAVLALYRPGPMAENMHNDYAERKHGYQPAIPFHPDAAEILKDTQQLMIYQEQIMTISQKFAGYSMSDADNLRRIIGKKLPEQMKPERVRFIEGCLSNGYSEDLANKVFNAIEAAASYSFNACLVGETLLSSPDGEISIDDVIQKLDSNEDVYLHAFDAEKGIIVDKCIDVIDAGIQEVFELTLSNGSTIEATMEHNFLCEDMQYHTLREIIDNDLEMIEP